MLCCVPQYFPPLKETPPNFCKYSNVENMHPKEEAPWQCSDSRSKGPESPCLLAPGFHTPVFQPPAASVSTAAQESPCLYPEHCPRHPLPTHLSGAGNFTKRDFALLGQGGGTSPGAPCVSLLCWRKHFVQVDQIYVPKSHLPLDQWSLPPTFEGGGRRGGCVRLMRTPGFLSGEKSKRNLSTPSLSSRDLPPSPLFTQTAKVGWVKKQPPFHTHCSVIHH